MRKDKNSDSGYEGMKDKNGIPFWSSPDAERNYGMLMNQTDAILDGSYEERLDEFNWDGISKSLGSSQRKNKESDMGMLGAAGDAAIKAPMHGVTRALEETVQFGYDALNFFDDYLGIDGMDNNYEFKTGMADWLKPETEAGGVVSSITQFVAGFAGSGKILGATKLGKALMGAGKAGKYANVMLQGALTDFITQDPHAERLSNLIEEFPSLQNPITEYLQTEKDDGNLEGRFKNALEGAGLGIATDAVFKGLKALKLGRQLKSAAGEESGKLAAQVKTAVEEADEAASALVKQQELVQDGVKNINGLMDNITEAAKMQGIDITEITGELKEVLEKAADGSIKEGDISKAVNGIAKKFDIIPEKAMQDGAEIVNIGELVENYVKRDLGGKITEPFRALKSLKNTDWMSDGVSDSAGEKIRRLFKSLEESDSFDRGAGETVRQSNKETFERAVKTVRSMMTDGEVTEAQLMKRLEQWGSLGEQMAEATVTMQAVVEEYGTRALKFLDKIEGMHPDDVKNMLDTEATEILARFAEVAQYQGRLTTGIGRGLQINQYFNRLNIEDMPGLKEIIDNKGIREATADEIIDRGSKEAVKRTVDVSTATKTAEKTQENIEWEKLAREMLGKKNITTADAKKVVRKLLNKEQVEASAEAIISTMTPEEKLQLLRRVSVVEDTMQKAKQLIPDTKTGKFIAMSNEYWVNSILSGLPTQFVNILGSAFKLGALMPVNKMMAASWKTLKTGEFDRELWNEGARAWASMYQVMNDAWRMAGMSLKKGHNILKPENSMIENQLRAISSEFTGLSKESGIGMMVDALGTAVNMPTRFMMAGDEFFSQLAYRSHIISTLYSKGAKRFDDGLLAGANRSEAIQQFIKDNYEKFLVDVKMADGEVIKNAGGFYSPGLSEAMEATYTKDLAAGSFSRKVQKAAEEHPLFKRVVPFVRTPMNIMGDVLAHTPAIANCTRAYREAMERGGSEAALAQTKVMMGSAMWLTAVMAAVSGNLTGSGPRNRAQREMLLETGWRPYSMKFGDEYISFARIEPIGSILGMAGDFAEIAAAAEMANEGVNAGEGDNGGEEENKILYDLAGSMIFSMFYNLSSKTYMRGVAEIMEAMRDKASFGNVLKAHMVSHVPSLFGSMRKLKDTEVKEVQGMMDEIKNKMPGLSETLPTKYSWLTGEPVLIHGGMAAGVSPILTSSVKDNPVAEELVKFPRAMLGIQKDIGGVRLTTEQLSDYERIHGTVKIDGKTLMQALKEVVESPEYDRERKVMRDTDEQMEDTRYLMLQDVVREYRLEARKNLFKIYPELRDELLKDREQGEIFKAAVSVDDWEVMSGKTAHERREAFYNSIVNY